MNGKYVLSRSQIKGDLDINLTSQALADLIHKEPKIFAKEVRCLQDKAWKARRRAGERREHRNQTQNTLFKRISLLTAALSETAPLQPKDRIKGPQREPCKGWDSYISELPSRNWLDNMTDGRSFSSRKPNREGEPETKQTR